MNLDTYYKKNSLNLESHIGWRYYNRLKKKAMAQEFSIAGLVISLSIAFFIVISAALVLSFVYNSFQGTSVKLEEAQGNIYFQESQNAYSMNKFVYSC